MLYLAQICTVAAEQGDTLAGEHSESITKHQSWAVRSIAKFRVSVASKSPGCRTLNGINEWEN